MGLMRILCRAYGVGKNWSDDQEIGGDTLPIVPTMNAQYVGLFLKTLALRGILCDTQQNICVFAASPSGQEQILTAT